MTTTIGYDEFVQMMQGAIEAIKANHEYLSQLDAATGDGDHGVTMLRAVNTISATITSVSQPDLKNLVYEIGWALLNLDSGSTGPLLGSLFTGMSEAITGPNLDANQLAAMFEAGLAMMQEQTKAKVGDKTMMDAIIPAVQALRQTAAAAQSIEETLQSAAAAAEQGARSTQNLQARFGRAKHQGARTLGHQDPGATSISLIFKGMVAGLPVNAS